MRHLLCCIFLIILLITNANAALVKSPNVAGQFYSNDPNQLKQELVTFFNGLSKSPKTSSLIIVPHAGYMYSGRVAAQAYQWGNPKAKTIIILAPSHYYPLNGVSIWSKGSFNTPLGSLNVDEDFSRDLMTKTSVVSDNQNVFDKEHSLEVQLPFIQHVYGNDVRIVPMIVGQPDLKSCRELAKALYELTINRDDILIILSSDMSHYHPYDEARRIDQETLGLLTMNDIQGFVNGHFARRIEMCGFMPVTIGMMLAELQGATQVDVIAYANSGDVTGDKNRVVGYGAVSFTRPAGLTVIDKKLLLDIARRSLIATVDGKGDVFIGDLPMRLMQPQGVFVTLKKAGQLRGCIGEIMPQQPLALAVQSMAKAAATQDPRFKPVSIDEVNAITIEISVLSRPTLSSVDEIELGKHGVIVTDGKDHQGVFLPQVATETGWTKEEFLSQLCAQKAGLRPDAYKDSSVHLYTFEANVFGENHER